MTNAIPNAFADRFKPRFGLPTVPLERGASFDQWNDLFLSDCGKKVFHRDGFVTHGSEASAPHDALIDYNRRHMAPAAFADHYDDGDESLLLMGAA